MMLSLLSVANTRSCRLSECQERGYLSLWLRREGGVEKEKGREIEEDGEKRGGIEEKEGEGRERCKDRRERGERDVGWGRGVRLGRRGRGGTGGEKASNLFLLTWPHQLSSHHLPTIH